MDQENQARRRPRDRLAMAGLVAAGLLATGTGLALASDARSEGGRSKSGSSGVSERDHICPDKSSGESQQETQV